MFTNHYGKLKNVLPVKNLSGYLVSERIINFDEEEMIQQAPAQSQAASIVLKNIKNYLQARHTKSFDTLLIIMKDHGGLVCEELANQIKGELESTTGRIAIAYYVHV